MAQTLPSVRIPFNTWVDLYAATGLSVGSQITVQNIGSSSARLAEAASIPASNVGFNIINFGDYRVNKAGNIGAWAYSKKGTNLQVELA